MDRLACVEVPDLLLQQALQDHPDRVGLPLVVVAEDRPLAPILQVGREAWDCGIRPGMRYAAALALVPALRGVAASDRQQALARDRLHRVLSAFSPAVEPSREHPGTLWADVRGMQRLFSSANAWGRTVREALAREGYHASVVVGFSRFATWALARTDPGVLALGSREREREALARVPLARLFLPPDRRDALEELGIRTVGDLLRLPRQGMTARFGAPVEELHRAASGEGEEPLRPVPVADPLREVEDLEEREEDPDRLLFWVKRLLDRILGRMALEGRALAALHLRWTLDDLFLPPGESCGKVVSWTVRLAEPATRSLPVLTLLRLRLESSPLVAPVQALALEAEAVPLPVGQLRLFRETRRDPEAALAVLARLRARFGEGAVSRPRLEDAWLPEEAGQWAPLEGGLQSPRPRGTGIGPRVRRVLPAPVELPIPGDTTPFPGLSVRGLGTVRSWKGPFLVSGRWWEAWEVRREYGYLETRDGQVLWVFREGGRWWLQGRVE